MARAIRVHRTGGPEVLQWEEVDVASPGPGEVLVRHTAVGLNFIDVYFRTGVYQGPATPFIPGMEAAGVVEAIGDEVTGLGVGERIAYATPPIGAYAEKRVIAADRVVRLPDTVDDHTAAAMMLKGMTAEYLLRRTCKLEAGDVIVFHAAAGGVGLIACQWARHLGVTVIGTVGSEEKAELARAHGCTHPVLYTQEDLVARVNEITDGRRVRVVYDSVGRDTFEQSLDCLQPLGMLVSFGQSSGSVPPLDIGRLSAKGSLYLTRPTLMTYTSTREDLVRSAGALLDVVVSGAVRVEVNQQFALAEAAQAHRALEGRRTTGSSILLP